jgi:hypothetical protein
MYEINPIHGQIYIKTNHAYIFFSSCFKPIDF